MSAKKKARLWAKGEPVEIKVSDIAGAAWNVHADGDADMEGLIGSIRKNGMVQRIAVRPVGEGRWEVVDGHRRLAAARALGWDAVSADCFDGLTDADAQMMTATANVQRLANDPVREAALIGRMMDGGRTLDEIAAAMGLSTRYVARRARLTSLSKRWADWFAAKGAQSRHAALMETVARYDATLQDHVFETRDVEERELDDLATSRGLVESWLSEACMELDDDVPFDVMECGCCPCNTANEEMLFPELVDECGRCQDRECFVERWNAAVDSEIERLRSEGVEPREARNRWDVPRYWESTRQREPGRDIPYVYEDEGLRHVRWSVEEEKRASAETTAEAEARKRYEADLSKWRKARQGALASVRRAAEGLDAALTADAVTASAAFREAMRRRWETMLGGGGWMPDADAETLWLSLGADALGLTADEDAALRAAMPEREEVGA